MAVQVITRAWCGIELNHGVFDSMDAARQRLKQRIAWAEKQGCEIDRHSPTVIEIGEPINAGMVPDYCGMLRIEKVKQ